MSDNVFPNLCYSNIEDAYDGGSFDMETFKDGTIMYHAKGGYTIIADYRMTSLNKTIRDFIDKLSGNIDISEDMAELIELDLASNLQVLNIPMYAFSDVNLKFELATKVIEYINGLYQNAIESKPEDEDVEANKIFHDAVIGSSNANEVKDYVKSKD